MVVGVVGKSCSGKDEAVKFLVNEGFYEINVDKLGHEALKQKVDELVSSFGSTILKDGEVDRKILGPIVFSDPEKLKILNSITHPWMCEETERLTKEHKNCVINAALLESMGLVRLCDEVLYVFAPLEMRLERALKRDGITEENFLARNRNQKDIGLSLLESGKWVITIINDQDKEYLYRQLSLYCDRLKSRGYING